jgi:L-lysine 2,3-aminomutase
MEQPKSVTNWNKMPWIPEHERGRLKKMTGKPKFRVNDYYLNLINENDPDDPLRKLVQSKDGFELTGYNRWVVSTDNMHELESELTPSETSSLLRTGGDRSGLPTAKLLLLLGRLQELDRVRSVRLSSKLPVFHPMRIYENHDFLAAIRDFSTQQRRIYVTVPIHHPSEMTAKAKRAIQALQYSGAIVMNHTPVLRGINDDPNVLAELLDRLLWAGIIPYHFWGHRPVGVNRDFALPLRKVYRIVEQAKAKASGLGKRVRLCISSPSGTLEIVAMEHGKAYVKDHSSQDDTGGKLKILDCDSLPGSDKHEMTPMEESVGADTPLDLPYTSPPRYVIMD